MFLAADSSGTPAARVLGSDEVKYREHDPMSNTALQVLAAAVVVTVAPAAAQAQNIAYASKSPVAITSFRINDSYSPGMIGSELEQAPQFVANDVSVKFVNTGTTPATIVKFALNAGRYAQTIVDKGTFGPGVQIKHDFAVGDGVDELPNATVNVTEVDFADGSIWHAAPADVVIR
jgi:hypothetical protein